MRYLYHSHILILVFGILSFGVFSPQTLAQTTTPEANSTSSRPVNWIVNCNNQANAKVLSCAMSQTLLDSKSRQRIASASIVKQAGGFTLVLSLPHGLDLASGVQLSVDGGARNRHAFGVHYMNIFIAFFLGFTTRLFLFLLILIIFS